MRGARPSLTISVADYFQNYQHGQKFINGGIASHAISCPFMFVLFPSMLVPIMRPLELKSCQSNQGVAAIWDTPPKSISVKRAQITQIFNYQVACRQENRVYDFNCASISFRKAHFLAGNKKISRKGPLGKGHSLRKFPVFLKHSEILTLWPIAFDS